LAIVFVLRLSRNSDRYAPKFIASYYGERVRNNRTRRVKRFRNQLMSAEIDRQLKSLKLLHKTEANLRDKLFRQISWLSLIYVSKFLNKQAQHDKEEFNLTHKRKLQNLGLDVTDVT